MIEAEEINSPIGLEEASNSDDTISLCQICNDASDGLHFGVYSCRACAAFFRRTVSLKLDYSCRAGNSCSVQHPARNMCRACRYNKCITNGMQITAVQLSRDIIGKRKDSYKQKENIASKLFKNGILEDSRRSDDVISPIDEQFAYAAAKHIPTLTSAFSLVKDTFQPMRLLPKMHEGYLHFLTIRRATNSMVENKNLTHMFSEAERADSDLRPSNFDTSKKVCQLEAHLVTDIVNTYFFPFDQLPFSDKVNLFKNFFCYLSHTDRAYQSYKLFGQDEGNDRMLMPDGGFIRSGDLEKYYANAEGVHSPPEEAAKIFRPAFEFILHVIIAHMRRIQITDLEYIAILGFFLWNDAVPDISPETTEIIYETQSIILADLHTHYRQMGLESTKISLKIGKLLLLLPKLTRSVVMMRENSELAELFNMFEADVCCKSFKTG